MRYHDFPHYKDDEGLELSPKPKIIHPNRERETTPDLVEELRMLGWTGGHDD
jgi:hypothetical protein